MYTCQCGVCTRVYAYTCALLKARGRSWVSKSIMLHFIPFESLVGLEARLVASKPQKRSCPHLILQNAVVNRPGHICTWLLMWAVGSKPGSFMLAHQAILPIEPPVPGCFYSSFDGMAWKRNFVSGRERAIGIHSHDLFTLT